FAEQVDRDHAGQCRGGGIDQVVEQQDDAEQLVGLTQQVERALRAAPLAALVAITLPEILRSSVLASGAAAAGAAGALAWLTDARLVSALVLVAVLRLTRRGVAALVAASTSYLALLAWAP
ncbi:MAG: hypothetical protein ACK4MU_08340, partial [Thermomonas sp.]